MSGESEELEAGPGAASLPLTKEAVDRFPWDKTRAFPAFSEVARRHPEAMVAVLPILDFFSHSYGPKLLELERRGGDPDRLVPQIEIKDFDRRADALKMALGNMCIWPDTSSVEGAVRATDWGVLGACLPFADYPTAVYLKHVIGLAIDDSVLKSLYKIWPEALSFKSSEAAQGAIWEIICPHIPYFLVGSPEESEPDVISDRLDYPSPWPERPSCPPFMSKEGEEEHKERHLKEFLALAKKVERFLTPEERKILADQRQRGKELGLKGTDPFWEKIDYQIIAWAAFNHGMEIPLDLFEDPRNLGGERFLYLFNAPGIRKSVLAVAVYPQGRKNLTPFKDREFLRVNLLSCFPLDNPRQVYEKKVKGKSSWDYLRFARELWIHSARRWARDPENSLSPREVQRHHLSVREIYGLSPNGWDLD